MVGVVFKTNFEAILVRILLNFTANFDHTTTKLLKNYRCKMENIREIANGTLLQTFNGKNVSVTGVATQMAPNNLSFQLKTVDDVNVKVVLKKPSRNQLQGLVEVHGIANGNSINCEEIIEFATESKENHQPFDAVAHNQLCELLNTAKRLWDFS